MAWWLERARACSDAIQQRGRQVLFVGGTPLYLKSLLRGLFHGPGAEPDLRQRLSEEAETIGTRALHERLARVDPVTADRLHVNDLRRIIRALEVWELTGKPISAWQQQWTTRRRQSDIQAAWLDLPRYELYARIDARVEQMFQNGLVDEVRQLLSAPRGLSREARQALGYKEAIAHLEDGVPLEKTTDRVKQHSRNFAKRQVSWFRHLPEVRPLSVELTRTLWQATI